jgi:hypothetical protein
MMLLNVSNYASEKKQHMGFSALPVPNFLQRKEHTPSWSNALDLRCKTGNK